MEQKNRGLIPAMLAMASYTSLIKRSPVKSHPYSRMCSINEEWSKESVFVFNVIENKDVQTELPHAW